MNISQEAFDNSILANRIGDDKSICWLTDRHLRVNCNDWLFDNIGRCSVAKRTPDKNMVDIIAYSDSPEDIDKLTKYARSAKLVIIRNLSHKGVSYVDKPVSNKLQSQEERERELYERFQAEIDETGMLLALIMGGEYNSEDKTIKWNELNSYTEDQDLAGENATEGYDPGDD